MKTSLPFILLLALLTLHFQVQHSSLDLQTSM